jgi:tetratricopeptide (TPR) repeat protein
MSPSQIRYSFSFTAASAALLALFSSPTAAQHDHHDQHQVLSKVHFPISCSSEAQAAFDEGMRLQHSFWYRESEKRFQEVLKADPTCVMAHWGRAMSLLYNPFVAPPAKNLAEGLGALQEAQRTGAKTEREAEFISALVVFYKDYDKKDHRTRLLEYEKAMETLANRLPHDPEAQIFYALALSMAASPTDKTYAKPLKAVGILEAEWERQPVHPGVVHYLVHAYDFPPIAKRGLKAAQRYGEITPDAAHALHMPSHIYTRVGYWQQSVEANSRASEIATKNDEPEDLLHASDYLVYAHLQMGQDEAARRVMMDRERLANAKLLRPSGPFALAAMKARLVMERGAWNDAASLQPNPTAFPYVDAITHYARAVGLARAGRSDEAQADVEALKRLVLAEKDAYWRDQVDVQRQSAEAWIAFAGGQRDEALESMRAAADRESKTEKHVVTPGPLAPARELLAEMLMEMNRPAEALKEFEAVQTTEPNRFRAVAGAANAAVQAGDKENARAHYAKLVEIAATADAPRPELEAARHYLSN